MSSVLDSGAAFGAALEQLMLVSAAQEMAGSEQCIRVLRTIWSSRLACLTRARHMELLSFFKAYGASSGHESHYGS